ncbi:MAG: glycosyltransferase [Lachnospiraceae bacterium]|nr:glycosyltransferase [Lachnospiraceae bacterium]
MNLQLLVAAVEEDVIKLSNKMNIGSDAIIVNQGDSYEFVQYKHRGGRNIVAYTFAERGVGLSRNTALMRADADIVLFSDCDIVYEDDYREKVLSEFEKNPKADMILFNVDVEPDRKTYQIDDYGRVRWYNCGRYPTYSMAVRLDKLRKYNICFSLLFGGGAKYSNGEDSLFIRDCIKKGLKVYKAPVLIGAETPGESTWFRGYTEKFFVDRGVLYHYLYGRLAPIMARRFIHKNKETMCQFITTRMALKFMKQGMKEAKK